LTTINAEERGPFGFWHADPNTGLPVFEYTCDEHHQPEATYFTTFGGSNTHYHLIGNGTWFAFVENHGQVRIIDAQRGFTMIGVPARPDPTGNDEGLGACIIEANEGMTGSDIDLDAPAKFSHRTFGLGYYGKGFVLGDLAVTNTVHVPAGCGAMVVSEICIENHGTSERACTLHSVWNLRHIPLSKSLIVSWHGRKAYIKSTWTNRLIRGAINLQRLARADTDGARDRHASHIRFFRQFASGNLAILQPRHSAEKSGHRDESSGINVHYRPVFIAMLDDEWDGIQLKGSRKGGTLDLASKEFPVSLPNAMMVVDVHKCLSIPAEGHVTLAIAFGSMDRDEIAPTIALAREIWSGTGFKLAWADWFRSNSIGFNVERLPWLSREVIWHAGYFLSSMFPDEFTGTPPLHRIPQGSVYLTGHGFDGAIRDYSLFLVPLTFMNPLLAREYLRFIYSAVDGEGHIAYAMHGFGKMLDVPFIHSNPSDQYFFLTWATCEYIFTTRDYAVLDELVVARGSKTRSTTTIGNLLRRLLNHVLSRRVGFGPHGLVRVCDGDWNDGISLMAKNRKTFIKVGESTFNSAMLLWAFPLAIPMVQGIDPDLAARMGAAVDRVKEAVAAAWNGAWYYRGYDGLGNPLGDATIFLDHLAWLLIDPGLEPDRAATLVRSIEEKLVGIASTGAAIMNPPNQNSGLLPPGWDINGGTWQALDWLLAWGLKVQAPEKSLAFIERASMHHRAEVYPNIWYGTWSAPDSFNADNAERPGEAFYHVSTPMCDFPFANNNLHGCFLLATIKQAGIQAYHDRFEIKLVDKDRYTFSSQVITIEKQEAEATIRFGNVFSHSVPVVISAPDRCAVEEPVDIQPASTADVDIQENKVTMIPSAKVPVESVHVRWS